MSRGPGARPATGARCGRQRRVASGHDVHASRPIDVKNLNIKMMNMESSARTHVTDHGAGPDLVGHHLRHRHRAAARRAPAAGRPSIRVVPAGALLVAAGLLSSRWRPRGREWGRTGAARAVQLRSLLPVAARRRLPPAGWRGGGRGGLQPLLVAGLSGAGSPSAAERAEVVVGMVAAARRRPRRRPTGCRPGHGRGHSPPSPPTCRSPPASC